ncbi:MAG: Maf family protein, partial [Myxococcota bacterium]
MQSTAPMRRTRDGQNHEWVRDVRDGRKPDTRHRHDILDRSSAADTRDRKLNREVRTRLAAEALSKHAGQKLKAEIVDLSPWSINLHFPDLGVEFQASAASLGLDRLKLVAQGTAAKAGDVRFDRGQTIEAKIVDADPHAGEVRFQFEGHIGKAQRAAAKRSGPIATHELAQVRGDGFESPLVGQTIKTRGVVSAVNRIGLFIQPEQSPAGAVTGGLLVRARNISAIKPGDVVEVEGRVHEQRNKNAQYDRTVVELAQGKAKVVGQQEAPKPVVLGEGKIPEIPADRKEAIEYWRQLLGQKVRVPTGIAVSPSNPFGDLAVVPEGWTPENAVRTPQGGVVMPDGQWNHQVVGMKVRAHAGKAPPVTVGDKIGPAEGVVIYRSGSFQVELTDIPKVTAGPPRDTPITRLRGEPGKVTVAGVNALNMHPGESERAEALAERIVKNMQSPDVIALQEIQDNDGPTKSDVTDADETYAMLIQQIKDAGGP